MSQIVAISSQKGGVGKTTVSVNLATACAHLGKRVLLIDADPQGGVGLSISLQSIFRRGVQEILRGRAKVRPLILSTVIDGLYIIPAGNCGLSKEPEAQAWVPFLAQLRTLDFDFIFIDCQPGLAEQVQTILTHADFFLTPQQTEPISLRSLMPYLSACFSICRPEQFLGIVFNFVEGETSFSKNILSELRQLLPEEVFFQTEVPRSDSVVAANRQGVPISLLEQAVVEVTSVFDQLAKELDLRIQTSAHTHGNEA